MGTSRTGSSGKHCQVLPTYAMYVGWPPSCCAGLHVGLPPSCCDVIILHNFMPPAVQAITQSAAKENPSMMMSSHRRTDPNRYQERTLQGCHFGQWPHVRQSLKTEHNY